MILSKSYHEIMEKIEVTDEMRPFQVLCKR